MPSCRQEREFPFKLHVVGRHCIWQHGQAKMRRCCTDEWQIIAQTTQKSENVRGKTTSSSVQHQARCFSRNPKIYTLIISLRCSFWVILCRCNFHFLFSSLFGRVDAVLYFDFEIFFGKEDQPRTVLHRIITCCYYCYFLIDVDLSFSCNFLGRFSVWAKREVSFVHRK